MVSNTPEIRSGMFRAHFQFDGLTGEVDEFVTFKYDPENCGSDIDTVALEHARSAVKNAYFGDRESVVIKDIEFRRSESHTQ